jgi:hypothetical protein
MISVDTGLLSISGIMEKTAALAALAALAQERLCRRYRTLARAGKLPTVITAG